MVKSKLNGNSYEEVEQSLKNKIFSPIYLFYGEEDFLVDQLVSLLIDRAVDRSVSGFNLDILHGDDADANDIVSIASAFPMMADRRVVVVREFDRLANKDILIPYVTNPLPSTLLVLLAEKIDSRTKIFELLTKAAIKVECKRLYEDRIPAWTQNRITQFGKKSAIEACQLIHVHVGNSLREIQNEIDKLLIYIGDKTEITSEDVDAIIGLSKRYNIFELQKSIGRKEIAPAQEILERMLGAGEYAVGIVVMLTKYFQKLWLLQEISKKGTSNFQIANSIGINQYFLNEYLEASKKYSSAHIEKNITILLETDEALKSSGGDGKLILTLMINRLINDKIPASLI